jgi:predicted  nucleic acid-binding Zn-ribbon protein
MADVVENKMTQDIIDADLAFEQIDFSSTKACPECGGTRFRTVTTWWKPNDNANGSWKYLQGCQVCEWEKILGNVQP